MSQNPKIPMSFKRTAQRRNWPLDRTAIAVMVGLAIAAAILVALGDHAVAKVQTFSWQERTVGANNVAFTLTFTRPMDPASVESNLRITPDLPGRVSWAGRRMAYTLDVPVPYGETYQVTIPDARDIFATEQQATQFEPFQGTFQSRDRAIAYIGTQGNEAGRLMLLNFSQGEDAIPLTPPSLQVLDFEPYPLGDRILFSATDGSEGSAEEPAPLAPALYTVATGIAPVPPAQTSEVDISPTLDPGEAGEMTPVLDSEVYQNLAFDLSPDGKIIVVQRVNQTDPADFGPWIIELDKDPRRLDTEPGGEFLIGPDSQTLLMLQGQGTAVIPLAGADEAVPGRGTEPLDFLPEFGRVFDISSDGTAAAMIDFNQNNPERRFTETLVLVTNRGEERELLNATGSIINAQFDPTDRILYVLASDLLPSEEYVEQPYLAAIALEGDAEPLKLLTLPPQVRVSMDVSPDGLAALVDISQAVPDTPTREVTQSILLPLFQTTEQRLAGIPTVTIPKILPLTGIHPQWLP